MKKLFAYIKWLLNDGRYVIIEGRHYGCCGKYYKEPYIIPVYQIGIADRWGLCFECRKMGAEE